MEATRQLAQTSQAALAQGTAELAGIQQQGRKYLEDYSAEVRGTLEAVRRDNEQLITGRPPRPGRPSSAWSRYRWSR